MTRTKTITLDSGTQIKCKKAPGKRRLICPCCKQDFRDDYLVKRFQKGLCNPDGNCKPRYKQTKGKYWESMNLKHRIINEVDFVVCPFENRWQKATTVHSRLRRSKQPNFSHWGKVNLNDEPLLGASATKELFSTEEGCDEIIQTLQSIPDFVGMPAVKNYFGMRNYETGEFVDNLEHLVGPAYFQRFLFNGARGGTPSRKSKNNDFTERERNRRFSILDSLPNGCSWDEIFKHFSQKDKGWVKKYYYDIFRLCPEYLEDPSQWWQFAATMEAGNIPGEYL